MSRGSKFDSDLGIDHLELIFMLFCSSMKSLTFVQKGNFTGFEPIRRYSREKSSEFEF